MWINGGLQWRSIVHAGRCVGRGRGARKGIRSCHHVLQMSTAINNLWSNPLWSNARMDSCGPCISTLMGAVVGEEGCIDGRARKQTHHIPP